RQRAAHPLSEAWGECQSLVDVAKSAPDPADAMMRLRSSLRRIIDSIWLLIVPRGRSRLVAVEIWFAEGTKHRDYLILYVPPLANQSARRDGNVWARTLADVGILGTFDLRQLRQAKALEAQVLALDLSAIPKKQSEQPARSE